VRLAGALVLVLAVVVPPGAARAEDDDDDDDATVDEIVGEEIIVVTGTRSETPIAATPVATEVVDRERIEQSGARTVAEALALRPGIWIERGVGGAAATMQGLGPEYVLVLVDGQRQIGRVGGAIDLDRLGVADVERIEVVRGPSSALYGADALGGVIQVITRPPADRVTAEGRARLDGRLGTEISGALGGGRAGWSGRVDGEWRRGDAIDRDPSDVATTIAAHDDARAAARGAWRPGESVRVDAGADYLRRDLRGIDQTGTGAVLDRRNLTEVAQAHVTARRADERTIVEARIGVSAFRDQYASDQRGGSELDRYDETRERLVEAAAQGERAIAAHRITAGVEGLHEALDSDRLSEPGARVRAAAYLQDAWRPGDDARVLVLPAVRVDRDSQFGTHPTPRLATRWDATDRIVVRAAAGGGYRAPSFKELLLRFENPGAGYVVEGNPALAPETSWSAQFGGEWRPIDALWLAVDAFDNELRDLIAAVTLDDGSGGGPIRFGYDNIGRASTRGGELRGAVTRGRAALELGYAFTRARDRDAGRALEGVPAHRASAALRWRDRDEALDAFVEAALTGPRPYYLGDDPMDATWTDPRVEIRARIARRFGDHLAFSLGVENLLDAGDDQLDPIAPRTLHVGVEARR